MRTYHPGSVRAEWEQLFDVADGTYLTPGILLELPELGAEIRGHLSEWRHRRGCPDRRGM